MQISNGKVVSFDYTLTDDAGQVIDSSHGREPLPYLHGAGNIVPGLEKALEGRAAGDQLNVKVDPREAYGIRDERLVQSVPRTAFAGVEKIEPGMQFQASASGQQHMVTVVAVEPDAIKIDANHPLAGKTLNFDVKIVEVRDATQEEFDHRHVHGPHGHHH